MRIFHALGMVGRLVHNPQEHALAGMGNLVLNIAAAQAAHGHKVVACGFSDPLPAGRATWRGVEIATKHRWTWARLSRSLDASILLPTFEETLRHTPIDILHIHEIGLLHLPFAKRRVMHLNVPLPAKAGASHLWDRADAVLCCSKYVRDSFLAISRFPPERTYVAYNGASMDLLSKDEVSEQRHVLGVDPNEILLLFAGALVPKKGPHVFLEALDSLKRNGQDGAITAIIVGGSKLWRVRGDDVEIDSYETHLHKQGKDLKVRFAGLLPHHELFRLYQSCDVVVVPSTFEDPHPLVVSEAMAAGKPVVASAVGGISETVLDGKTGMLFPAGDHEALAEAILQLATNPELRHRLGQAGLERSKLFSWEVTAKNIDDVYEEILRH